MLLPLLLALAPATPPAAPPSQEATSTLLVSGFDEVLAVGWNGEEPVVSLRLDVGTLDGVPEALRGAFGTTDECKPTGDAIWIASSGGAVARYDVPTGAVTFAAAVPNAHSVEPLPGGRVVSAASVHAAGDRLLVHDVASGELVQEFPLPSAHGVVFDAERGRLYALGRAELQRFAVDGDTGELALEARFALPEGKDAGGHDLRAVPRSSELIVTTERAVWLFDRDLGRFRIHPQLRGETDVKSMDVHPVTGRIAYVRADEGEWWSTRVHLANPEGVLELPGERFYKARWGTYTGAPEPALLGPAPSPAELVPFRLLPEAPTAHLLFGSCADEDEGTARAWRRATALAPDAFVLLGDTPYIDSTDPEVQRRRHAEFLAFPPFADLARTTPCFATWDDHDFGRNDVDGRLEGKEHARAAWVEAHSRWPFQLGSDTAAAPRDGADSDSGTGLDTGPRAGREYGIFGQGIFHAFRQGPVEVFLLDTRWFARTEPSEFDPDQPTLLGQVQWDWLRTRLRASTAPFKVLACGMIWNGAVRPGKHDHWGAYPAEFEGLCRFLGEARISGVVLVGGDIHRSRVVEHDTTALVGYPLTEYISSPMHARIIDLANQPHPGLRFDTGQGHVLLELTADAERLFATFHTPDAVLHREVLRAEDLRAER